ncbi:hypothetical protein PUN28_017659 [Cardiocondyla obscurior]|uniref:Uncharacterized protein n=1 Tax=Cardiocondyla obscurior TaxID=286306 RepID=A0AAW2EN91_9HYME
MDGKFSLPASVPVLRRLCVLSYLIFNARVILSLVPHNFRIICKCNISTSIVIMNSETINDNFVIRLRSDTHANSKQLNQIFNSRNENEGDLKRRKQACWQSARNVSSIRCNPRGWHRREKSEDPLFPLNK